MVYSVRGRPYRSRFGLPLLSSRVRSHRHMPGGTSGINRPAWSRGTRGAGSNAATNGDARKDAVRSPTCSTPLLYWHEAVDGSTEVIIKLNVQTTTIACTMVSSPADTGFPYMLIWPRLPSNLAFFYKISTERDSNQQGERKIRHHRREPS